MFRYADEAWRVARLHRQDFSARVPISGGDPLGEGGGHGRLAFSAGDGQRDGRTPRRDQCVDRAQAIGVFFPQDLLAKLRPGIDGVVLELGANQATYLPQVWEQLPEKQAFLEELCRKAGLSESAWRDPETKVLVYQVEAFNEPEEQKH